jgi:hypothetical protein
MDNGRERAKGHREAVEDLRGLHQRAKVRLRPAYRRLVRLGCPGIMRFQGMRAWTPAAIVQQYQRMRVLRLASANRLSLAHRIHCASTRLCISLAFIGQERAWPSTSHALCVIVPVLLPRLHWAGTRWCICIACIVRHGACASSSPSLGRNALGQLHRMHCATSCPCFSSPSLGRNALVHRHIMHCAPQRLSGHT